jgi:hypothetical protein
MANPQLETGWYPSPDLGKDVYYDQSANTVQVDGEAYDYDYFTQQVDAYREREAAADVHSERAANRNLNPNARMQAATEAFFDRVRTQ